MTPDNPSAVFELTRHDATVLRAPITRNITRMVEEHVPDPSAVRQYAVSFANDGMVTSVSPDMSKEDIVAMCQFLDDHTSSDASPRSELVVWEWKVVRQLRVALYAGAVILLK